MRLIHEYTLWSVAFVLGLAEHAVPARVPRAADHRRDAAGLAGGTEPRGDAARRYRGSAAVGRVRGAVLPGGAGADDDGHHDTHLANTHLLADQQQR